MSGADARMRNSVYNARGGLSVGPGARVEKTLITLTRGPLRLGAGAEAQNNRITGIQQETLVSLEGGGILFRDNVLSGLAVERDYILVESANNVVVDNILYASDPPMDVAIRVAGTANVLRGNLALPATGGERWGTGIAFEVDGNFYGDNQAAALVPFELGATVQTDWGDNHGF